jgi:hypothetical protein
MSRFRILRVDHFDPVRIGKRNRFMFAVYAVIPTLFMLTINTGMFGNSYSPLMMIISLVVLGLIYYFLLKKMRATINDLKTIGELEITQSCMRKHIGDSVSEYNFQQVKEIRLIKHIPATRLKESKSRYFSYILKIVFHNKPEELLVISDRSVDHNQKISFADTMKTLKKIVPFDVILEI